MEESANWVHEAAEKIKNERRDLPPAKDGRKSSNSNISIREEEEGLNNALRYEKSTSCLREVYELEGRREYGELADVFDEYMMAFPEPHKKKDVADVLDCKHSDRSFIALLYRKTKAGQIKPLPNDYIVWVNTDWKAFKVDPSVAKRPYLDLKLPFGAESLIAIPEKAQIIVAGDGGGGKTHWGYTFADLNLDKLPIRHFVVEDGDQRMVRLLEDYPLLEQAYLLNNDSYSLVNPSKGQGLIPADNLDPEGLNIYDYYRVPDRKDWYLAVQKEMIKCSDNLTTGAVAIMIQKKRGESLGYGREFTKMQCEVAFSMWIDKNVKMSETDYGYKKCHITIEKARDLASKQIPEAMACGYKTAPLHGKLVSDVEGWIGRENFES